MSTISKLKQNELSYLTSVPHRPLSTPPDTVFLTSAISNKGYGTREPTGKCNYTAGKGLCEHLKITLC
jgi:hypothetical protein